MSTKVWLYQTHRAVEHQEQELLQNQMDVFAAQWQAHGKNLQAKFWFHNPYLLICEVDETIWGASGCSIDSKVRFLKDMNDRYELDFFVRMKTIVKFPDGKFKQVDFADIKQLGTDIQVLNPTVVSSEQFEALFTTINESPMKRLMI